jgi:phosphoglycerate dehydrogenase-like enzyme
MPTTAHAVESGDARPLVLLWLDEADLYLKAAADAGLTQKLEFAKVPAKERPDAALLARAEGVLAWSLPSGIIPSMPKLRWIQTQSAGVEGWLARPDLDAAINLTCARGVHMEQMPDNIIAAIYYVAKPYDQARRQQEERAWKRLMPEPLTGKTLGIIGLGTIGADLARRASVLGMRVIGVKRTPEPVPNVEAVHTLDQLDLVLAQSDFAVLLLPVTPATENVINARTLRHMKKSGWLFNFARGALLVDADLIAAAEAGTIAGAVLDVFRTEPLPSEHPFWSTKNIVVLPHVGGVHPRRDKFVAALFVENAQRFADGRPLQALVDRARGY